MLCFGVTRWYTWRPWCFQVYNLHWRNEHVSPFVFSFSESLCNLGLPKQQRFLDLYRGLVNCRKAETLDVEPESGWLLSVPAETNVSSLSKPCVGTCPLSIQICQKQLCGFAPLVLCHTKPRCSLVVLSISFALCLFCKLKYVTELSCTCSFWSSNCFEQRSA